MSENGYAALSGVYDLLNDQIDYDSWADYICACIDKYKKVPTTLMLDLGCGTGKMTFKMRERGYDMTGLDISPEMLSEAADICRREGIDDILWLCSDMSDFELYGTVDAAVCCLDGINHLTEDGDLEKCLALVHNYLVPDGIFIFDVNTPHKFDTVYARNDYILEDDGVLFAWQNDYDPESRICTFYMTVFSEDDDGRYEREDSEQCERCFERRELEEKLTNAGFEILNVSGDYDFKAPADDCDRWYFTVRCKK